MKFEETARRLRKAMHDNNMKAVDLCNRTGISKASISQYYNGIHQPTNISAGKMALVLGVNPMWLMGFDVPEKVAWTPETQELREEDYYLNDETRDLAHFIYTHPEYQCLFDASRKVKPEDIKKALKAVGIFIEED